MNDAIAISAVELQHRLPDFPPVTLIDVRRQDAFARDPVVIPGALRRAPEVQAVWAADVEPWRPVVVYCVHGHEVSQNAAAALRDRGIAARHLDGGIDGWRALGLPVTPYAPPSRWVTRARPKIDRIACPWLIRRFIDTDAEFAYVAAADVLRHAASHDATTFDVPDVAYGHVGDRCSFDAFISRHGLDDAALGQLARIVRAADTGTPDAAPEASGLLAMSMGLSTLFADDHAMLRAGMLVYDSLYASCRGNATRTQSGATR
jgi:rhodanese-related sulfurtransferase